MMSVASGTSRFASKGGEKNAIIKASKLQAYNLPLKRRLSTKTENLYSEASSNFYAP